MNAIHSKPAASSHLNLFTVDNSDISATNSFFVEVFPTTSVSEATAPIEFNVMIKIYYSLT
jgi:uncharacterized protein (UPF0333 family)